MIYMFQKNIYSSGIMPEHCWDIVGHWQILSDCYLQPWEQGEYLVSKNVAGLVQLYNLNVCCPDGKCSKN